MNKKLTLTFALAALLAAGNANADTKLVAKDTSTSTTITSFSLGDISQLQFADGNLVVTLNDKTTRNVALSTTLELTFDDVATAIGQVKTSGNALGIAYDGQQLSASGIDGTAEAAVYSIGGQKVIDLKAWNGIAVSTASLESGVYILKVNNKSFKFVKK